MTQRKVLANFPNSRSVRLVSWKGKNVSPSYCRSWRTITNKVQESRAGMRGTTYSERIISHCYNKEQHDCLRMARFGVFAPPDQGPLKHVNDTQFTRTCGWIMFSFISAHSLSLTQLTYILHSSSEFCQLKWFKLYAVTNWSLCLYIYQVLWKKICPVVNL